MNRLTICKISLIMAVLSLLFIGCNEESPLETNNVISDVYNLWEDFEDENINTSWQTEGDDDWEIKNNRYRFGSNSAGSGSISNSESSSIIMNLKLEQPSIVSFYATVSSEQGYDWLVWELDDKIIDGISGLMSSSYWIYESFTIPPGEHQLEWRYEKDDTGTDGLDCGWIDGIMITNYSNQNEIIEDDHYDLHESINLLSTDGRKSMK